METQEGFSMRQRSCDCPCPNFNGEACVGIDTEVTSTSEKLDGKWGGWGAWSEREGTKNPFNHTRRRLCNNPTPLNGGEDCEGEDTQTRVVYLPIDGAWGGWSEWALLPDESGVATRERMCDDPPPNELGRWCDGRRVEEKRGMERVDGQWGPWQEWSELKRHSNPEERVRERFCDNPTPVNNGSYCRGYNLDVVVVFTPIDGGWGHWSPWSDLRPDSPIVTRSRSCNKPEPTFNGRPCLGSGEEMKDVNKATDGDWGPWSDWSKPEAVDGVVVVVRKRHCDNPTPANGGEYCDGDDEEEEEREAPVDGGWSEWSEWLVDLDARTKRRTRACTNPLPSNGGVYCEGVCVEEYDVVKPVDGTWGEWGKWVKDKILNTNPEFLERKRHCVGPANGGRECEGKKYEYRVIETPVDGQWGAWSGWEPTNGTSELLQRSRECSSPPPHYGGDECLGVFKEYKPIVGPLNGNWGAWSRWEKISDDRIKRTRKCDQPPPSEKGKDCPGPSSEDYLVYIPVDGMWSGWSEWVESLSDFSVLVRERQCDEPAPRYNGRECTGKDKETKNKDILTNGGWGEWSLWSQPSGEDNPEWVSRTRLCDNPIPSNGGLDCEGEDEETKEVVHPIDGEWSEWSKWKKTYDPKQLMRTRECNDPSQNGGRPCLGLDKDYAEKGVPRHGFWCPWELFSQTTNQQIPEVVVSRRYCECPTPEFGGDSCEGPDYEERLVFQPIKGGWSEWSPWSALDNNSTEVNRTRSCSNPPPAYNGADCEGANTTTKPITDPVNGNWGEWGQWSMPQLDRNPEELLRQRYCDSPAPANGGMECVGEGRDVRLQYNPVDGGWSEWSEYTTVPGQPDRQYRTRSCSNPEPSYGGLGCVGEEYESKNTYGPEDGGWSDWSPWSTPTARFNPETLLRRRYCNNPTPSNGGKPCEGPDSDTTQISYPIHGGWTDWSEWSQEKYLTNPETITRTRTCTVPVPAFGGDDCEGDDVISKEVQRPIDGAWGPWGGWHCPQELRIDHTFLRTRHCNNPTPQFEGMPCPGRDTDVIVMPTRAFFFFLLFLFFCFFSFILFFSCFYFPLQPSRNNISKQPLIAPFPPPNNPPPLPPLQQPPLLPPSPTTPLPPSLSNNPPSSLPLQQPPSSLPLQQPPFFPPSPTTPLPPPLSNNLPLLPPLSNNPPSSLPL